MYVLQKMILGLHAQLMELLKLKYSSFSLSNYNRSVYSSFLIVSAPSQVLFQSRYSQWPTLKSLTSTPITITVDSFSWVTVLEATLRTCTFLKLFIIDTYMLQHAYMYMYVYVCIYVSPSLPHLPTMFKVTAHAHIPRHVWVASCYIELPIWVSWCIRVLVMTHSSHSCRVSLDVWKYFENFNVAKTVKYILCGINSMLPSSDLEFEGQLFKLHMLWYKRGNKVKGTAWHSW